MMRPVIGIVLASVILYVWGFVVWGMGPYPTMIWKQAENTEETQNALREHFPKNGTYFVPGTAQEEDVVSEQFRSGPVAFVHMLKVDGREAMDPSIMINGFIANCVLIVFIAILIHMVSPALPTYSERVKFTAIAGLACSILTDIGDSVWWQIDWGWSLYRGFYHVTTWIVTGLVLGFFVGTGSLSVKDEPTS